MALIEVERLSVTGRVADVSLALEAGEVLGVIGPNGSGKSSLLKSLAGLLPCRGQVRFNAAPRGMRNLAELPPETRARLIGYLPQSCASAWSLTVANIVALGRLPWRDGESEQGQAAIRRAMETMDVLHFAGRKIDRLSGGEQARVWLARVFAGAPRLILADEPVASLDLRFQQGIMVALRRHADETRAGVDCGVILALHDLNLAARHCDRLCLMQNGVIRAFGPPEAVLANPALPGIFGLPLRVDLRHDPPVVLPA
ncbi:MAG: ABC transporter ATP-binding protein [Zoogloeaceae bacterium]|jgi:iron complex transport system ATP-binding protein|nr:ABC transporter ATP-binding protein [Zoogloeaceae bacterium]